MKRRIISTIISTLVIATLAFTLIAPTIAAPEDTEQTVLKVTLPTTVSITLDPFEMNGKGQVYSEAYPIVNNGESDVLLTFTDIRVTFANDSDFLAVAEPFDDTFVSDRKAMYLALDFGREDIAPVVITDSQRKSSVAIPLYDAQSDFSSVALSFSGFINYLPELDWLPGDIRITMTYKMVIAPPPVVVEVELIDEEAGAEDAAQPEITDTELPDEDTALTETIPQADEAQADETQADVAADSEQTTTLEESQLQASAADDSEQELIVVQPRLYPEEDPLSQGEALLEAPGYQIDPEQ